MVKPCRRWSIHTGSRQPVVMGDGLRLWCAASMMMSLLFSEAVKEVISDSRYWDAAHSKQAKVRRQCYLTNAGQPRVQYGLAVCLSLLFLKDNTIGRIPYGLLQVIQFLDLDERVD